MAGKLKKRSGKLIVTSGGKVAKSCADGCIVEFGTFGGLCASTCPGLAAIVGIPILVPPSACHLDGDYCFEVWEPLPVTCPSQTYNYVYIEVRVHLAGAIPTDLEMTAFLTQNNSSLPPCVNCLQVFFDGFSAYSNPNTVTSTAGCSGNTAEITFL